MYRSAWRRGPNEEESEEEFRAYNRVTAPWLAGLVVIFVCWKVTLLPEVGVAAFLLLVPAFFSWAYSPRLFSFLKLRSRNDGLTLSAIAVALLAVFFLANDAIEDALNSWPYYFFVGRWPHAILAVAAVVGGYRFLRVSDRELPR